MNYSRSTQQFLKSLGVISLSACLLAGPLSQTVLAVKPVYAQEKKKSVSARENFYQSVNADWLAKTKLKKGESAINSFSEIEERMKKLLVSDMNKMASGEIQATNAEQEKMVAYYKQAMDFAKRDQDGIEPLKPILAKIESVSSMQDLQKLIYDFSFTSFAIPFSLTVETNPQDNSQKQLVLRQAPAILESPEMYEKGNKEGQLKLEAYRTSMMALLKQAGKSDKEAKSLIKRSLAFDKLLSEKTQLDQSQMTAEDTTAAARYHPESLETVDSYADEFSFKTLIESLVGPTDKKINVEDQAYFKQINDVLNSKQLENMKAWLLTNVLFSQADFLGEENRQAASTYGNLISGLTQMPSKENNAYTQLEYTFGHILGDYYGKKYFGEDAKKDVESMAKKIIAVYKKRLSENKWLSDSAKEMAIKKLDQMNLMIGFSEDYPDLYRQYQFDSNASFFENNYNYKALSQRQTFEDFNKPNVRGTWQMSANAVNAYNDSSSNSIVFPAAILQTPFYDKTKSVSQNYGAIGAIIGHEISHAFDINGMKYDENGNLKDWWTKKDLEQYQEKTQAMVDQWDGLKTDAGKVNGQQTLAENIADNGGLMSALEALKTEENPNFKEFFQSWASVWRQKSTKEQSKFALESDVHAPYELRANIPVQNFQEFYDAFGIKKGDPMYMEPQKRVTLW
ncbi:M13 family metallopeptidase [Streptococcus loxodontisalivarius]|uniref:Endopeptidase n=1 Tax=Streptococcus loxodontisalivarius TaxID=1349415 RepID=A0ABS2PTR0_9STRE|nr:M13 family metallopeptidase [Streptococcus loxodontisalivarius]MBM7643437.1 putative endopeptidase [Streptococcus loxodontisalivarius]